MKRISIDPITRLEGHGKIDIFLDDQGKLWVPGMMEGKVYRMTIRR